MLNLNNNELDDLFRDGADSLEFPYKESSWAQMEQMLDQEESKRKKVWYIAGLVLLLALGGIGYAMFSGSEVDHSTNEGSAQNVATVNNLQIDAQGVSIESETTPTSQTSPSKIDVQETEIATSTNTNCLLYTSPSPRD